MLCPGIAAASDPIRQLDASAPPSAIRAGETLLSGEAFQAHCVPLNNESSEDGEQVLQPGGASRHSQGSAAVPSNWCQSKAGSITTRFLPTLCVPTHAMSREELRLYFRCQL